MQNISVTGVSMAVFAVMALLKYFNVADINEDQVAGAINNLIQLVSFATMLYGQLRRKDLKLGLYRK